MLRQGSRDSGVELSEAMVASFELFATELKTWNRKINLTAITRDEDIAVKHFMDSLYPAQLLDGAERLLDIGSGAGMPAIPLKIVLPGLRVVSVDAVGKKIHFQRHMARLLQFKQFEALHARVETLHATRPGAFDVIISRAFSSLTTFVSLAGPLLADNGRMVAMKGAAAAEELSSEGDRLQQLGYQISAEHNYELPFGSGKRCLIVITPFKSP
ncbi:16S rRNA (guanine(527)-N(7))-methyltransferase RsmG [Geobacter sp. SVR]|uniref:16S rRNA (guanine(527)-N(7))-methyltransferase RsmG n=1 Tax=Geobacter sp. SVR TaxID=2495594 RepID=UPI0015643E21